MRISITASALAMSVMLASHAALASPVEATAHEKAAIELRTIQSELMVAALHCRKSADRDVVGLYNSFVTKFRGSLIRNADVLTAYFKRRDGAAYQTRFDAFVTRLANEAALNSARNANYCQTSRAVLQAVLRAGTNGLERLATIRVAEEVAQTR